MKHSAGVDKQTSGAESGKAENRKEWAFIDNMGLATDIIRFFKNLHQKDGIVSGKSITDFVQAHPRYNGKLFLIKNACEKLADEGILIFTGCTPGLFPLAGNCYIAPKEQEEHEQYGTYDFIAFGFTEIRKHFESSVLPILVETHSENGEVLTDIGTGFLIVNNQLITAAHCIKPRGPAIRAHSISIPDWNLNTTPLSKIYIPEDYRIDLAILEFDGDPFPDVPKLMLGSASILDEVLSMGYPPIPGFDAVQISETAQISGHLKSSVGQVISESQSILNRQDYLLITAKVKGGNSGGPIIGRKGSVVGVVSDLSAGQGTQADTMGFGVAIPAQTVVELIEAIGTDQVMQFPFEIRDNSVRTTYRPNYY